MANPHSRGQQRDKPFRDALRIVMSEEDPVRKKRRLRLVAEKLYEQAMAGEDWAFAQIGDRLDGKPAQETTINTDANFDNMTDQEIVQRINELRSAGAGASEEAQTAPADPSKLN